MKACILEVDIYLRGFKGLYLENWYIFETLTLEIGGEFEKHPFYKLYLLGWGFHAKSVFIFNIFSGDLPFDALVIGLG